MKRILLNTLLFFVIHSTWSQKYDEIRGAENLAQGYTSLNKENSFSLFNHTASAVFGDSNVVSLEIKNRYNLKETNSTSFAIGKNLNSLFLGGGIKRYGSTLYNENLFQFGLAKKLNSNFSLGINIGVGGTRILSQTQQKMIQHNLSARYILSPRIEFGTNYMLIAKSNTPNYYELKLGLRLNLAQNFNWCIEVLTPNQRKPVLYTGIDFNYQKNLNIRLGSYQNFNAITGGFGLKLHQTCVNFYTECFVNTGWSNGISINHVF